MDNMQNMGSNELQIVNYSMMSDARKRPRSQSDIMTLRLKNRERQRRYRARKRLEADTKNSSIIIQPTQLGLQFESNENVDNFARRVHGKRDWKKDARRANASTGLEAPSDHPSTPEMMIEKQIVADSVVEADSNLEGGQSVCEKQKYVANRRDWKAEARSKKQEARSKKNEGDDVKL